MTPVESPSGAAAPGAHRNAHNSRMKSVISWTVTAFSLGLVVLVVVYGSSREEPGAEAPPKRLANVEVQAVTSRSYREALILPARAEARKVAAVAPEFGGKLDQWLVQEGEQVVAGQRVALLDTVLLRTQLTELEARRTAARRSVDRARAGSQAATLALENARKQANVQALAQSATQSDLDLAETEFRRVEQLVRQGVMDEARLDTERNARTQAEIRVQQAEEAMQGAELGVQAAAASLEEAHAAVALAAAGIEELDASIEVLRVQLDKSGLRAPVSGRLEEHLLEPGEVVAAGVPIARVYDLETLHAVVDVPDRYVAFLDPGNPAASEYIRLERPQARQEVRAWLELPGLPKLTGGQGQGVQLPAQVVRIDQAADPASNTFAVELQATNPGAALKHGMIVRARIEYLTYPEAIVIPLRAVQVTDAGPRVLVAQRSEGQDVARVRDIEPASVQGDEMLVLSGLAAGERLVVSGWKGLISGEQINVVLEDGVTAAAVAE